MLALGEGRPRLVIGRSGMWIVKDIFTMGIEKYDQRGAASAATTGVNERFPIPAGAVGFNTRISQATRGRDSTRRSGRRWSAPEIG